MQYLEPTYTVPSRRTITSHIQKLYDAQKAKLIEKMNDSYISFTSDHWTSLANERYMAVTGHFLNDAWELQSAVLSTCPMPGPGNLNPLCVLDMLYKPLLEQVLISKSPPPPPSASF